MIFHNALFSYDLRLNLLKIDIIYFIFGGFSGNLQGFASGGSVTKHLWQIILICSLWGMYSIGKCNATDSPAVPDSANGPRVSIFVDCSFCDQDYFRTELPYFDFVRDRLTADIHVLISRQATGGGGVEYALEFIGRNQFAGMIDTVNSFTRQSDTDERIRSGLVKTIQLGMVRFIARTPMAENLAIQYHQPGKSGNQRDKWNYWVFSLSESFSASGERSKKTFDISGSIEAKRTTEQSRIWAELNGWYQQTRYADIGLGLSRSRSAEGGIILSAGAHWGVGIWSELSASTYDNRSLQWLGGLAAEFNIFPYKESTRRQIRIGYFVMSLDNQYEEMTVFNKTREWLVQQKLSCDTKIIKPWGTISGSAAASEYFHDMKKYRLVLDCDLSLRLVEGLSLELSGGGSWYNDQLSLRKSDASEEQIISGRRELPTTYEYWTGIGLKYTFGSIYNNVVNARFGE